MIALSPKKQQVALLSKASKAKFCSTPPLQQHSLTQEKHWHCTTGKYVKFCLEIHLLSLPAVTRHQHRAEYLLPHCPDLQVNMVIFSGQIIYFLKKPSLVIKHSLVLHMGFGNHPVFSSFTCTHIPHVLQRGTFLHNKLSLIACRRFRYN